MLPMFLRSDEKLRVRDGKAWGLSAGGGALNFFFSGRGVRPGFPSVGLANWYLPLKRGLVNWKFPNLGACDLKISKFGGLWAKTWVKIEAVEAKISKFSQRGSCELTLLLEMVPLRTTGEAWKGGLQGRTSQYPLSRSVPLPGLSAMSSYEIGPKERALIFSWDETSGGKGGGANPQS